MSRFAIAVISVLCAITLAMLALPDVRVFAQPDMQPSSPRVHHASVQANGSSYYYGWGEDDTDELGDGGGTPCPPNCNVSAPEGIALPTGVGATAIAASFAGGLAIGTDDVLYAWGVNDYGELGDGSTTPESTPEEIALAPGVYPVQIAQGAYTSYAIGSDGKLYVWGENNDGQLGDGTTSNTPSPEVITLASGVTATAVTAGLYYTLAIGSDGNVYAWGDNDCGNLGDGTTTQQDSPVKVTLPVGVTAEKIAAGEDFSFAIGSDGKIYAWGCEASGALGNGVSSNTIASTPVAITLPGAVKATDISAGMWEADSLAAGADGEVYGWGDNVFGTVGNGTRTEADTPVQVRLPNGVAALRVWESGISSFALGGDGHIYVWGANSDGDLGIGVNQIGPLAPEQLPGPVIGTNGEVATGVQFTLATSAPPTCTAAAFTEANPPTTSVATFSYAAFFHDEACEPVYGLENAPDWLTVDPVTGVVSGVVPQGTTSFSYEVTSTSAQGDATAGPFTVPVTPVAAISGQVVTGDGSPAGGVSVQSCMADGACATTTTDASGDYTVAAGVGSTATLTAYPPPTSLGSDSDATVGPLNVGSGLTGQTITLPGTVSSLPSGLSINGSTQQPVIYWTSDATASDTGSCANGLNAVVLTGANAETGQADGHVGMLAQTTSGTYDGTLPAAYPIHGPTTLSDVTSCPESPDLIPRTGPPAGGTSVLVSGAGFTQVTAVLFGNTPATGFIVESDSSLAATAPPGIGDVPVTVVTAGGDISAGTYAYTGIASVSPSSGPASGGTTVDITGGGFSEATGVEFGSTPAQSYTVVSDTEIKATAPAGTGSVDVQVLSPEGDSVISPGDEFTDSGTSPARPAAAVRPDSLINLPGGFQIPAIPNDFQVPGVPCLTAQCIQSWISNVLTQLVRSGLQLIASEIEQYIANKVQAYVNQVVNELHQALCTSAGQYAAKQAVEALIAPALDDLVEVVVAYFVAETTVVTGSIGGAIAVAVGRVAYVAAIMIEFTIKLRTIVQKIVGKILDKVVDAAIEAAADAICDHPEPDPNPPADNTLIDPSGTVTDTNGNPIDGATVTILESGTAAGPFTAVSPSSPGIQPAINPETTTKNGVFHWDVSAGYYELQASAPGCYAPGDPSVATVTSAVYQVPPPRFGIAVTLACSSQPPPPRPVVTGLTVGYGSPSGKTQVGITGSGFTPGSAVSFGGVSATGVTYLSPTELTAIAPAHAAATVSVNVTTGGGTSANSAADRYSYAPQPTVTTISPKSGPARGGTTVTITGSGFTGVRTVAFGSVPAASFRVLSATRITAVAPAGQLGAVSLTVGSPGGVSAVVSYAYQRTATRVVVSSSANPSAHGFAVSFAATVSPHPDAGKVQFAINGKQFGAPVAVNPFTGVAATAAVKKLGLGANKITARYLGDPSYTASQPASVTQVVKNPAAPRFTSPKTVILRIGKAGTFTPRATGLPVPAITERGSLPKGLRFAHGALTGTPASGTAARYSLTFTAVNGVGKPVVQHFILVVVASPSASTTGVERAAGRSSSRSFIPGR